MKEQEERDFRTAEWENQPSNSSCSQAPVSVSVFISFPWRQIWAVVVFLNLCRFHFDSSLLSLSSSEVQMTHASTHHYDTH